MSALPPRSQVAKEDTWNLQALYSQDEMWEQEFATAQSWPEKIASWKGKLQTSAEVISSALTDMFAAQRQIHKLYIYAHLRNDEDLGNALYQTLYERARKLYYDLSAAASFLSPELLAIEQDTLTSWMKTPILQKYHVYLRDILRKKPHTLPQEQEHLLSMAAEPLAVTSQIFSMLNNLDIPGLFGQIKDEDNNLIPLSHGTYARLTESSHREIRRDVFFNYMKGFQQHRNTLAVTLEGKLKANIFQSKARHYATAREAALFVNQIPTDRKSVV